MCLATARRPLLPQPLVCPAAPPAMATRFAEVQQAPPIEVFAVSKAFQDSTHDKKVNLSVGGTTGSLQYVHHNSPLVQSLYLSGARVCYWGRRDFCVWLREATVPWCRDTLTGGLPLAVRCLIA